MSPKLFSSLSLVLGELGMPGGPEGVIGSSDTFLFKYSLSCVAATVAETATYPLDLTKTRLQIQGERATKGGTDNVAVQGVKRGMIRTASGIVKEEGFLKLWQGVGPAILRHYVYTGVRTSMYEYLRENVFRRSSDGMFPIWKSLTCGVLAGAVGQYLASPTDLVKVQMQMEGRRRLQGLPPRVNGLMDAVRSVVRTGGVGALWKGWVPNCQRAALVNMADLATYDRVKHELLRRTRLTDDYVTHALSSACAGLSAAVVSTPADVVKTRVMNQSTDPQRGGVLYKSSLDCLIKTIRQEGFWALYKGFVPIWARMAPWSLTFWVSYEQVRRLMGTPSF